jgi:Sec7-like guanine-nucleotide exchange factor
MHTSEITRLNEKLVQLQADQDEIEISLQDAWNKVFENSVVIKAMVAKVENSTDYVFDKYGEIAQETRCYELDEFNGCQEYLENYLQENHSISIEWAYLRLLLNCGSDNLIIQDDSRHDNGVWCEGKCVIEESEYKDENTREVNETLRNKLIEAYMEKKGFFPGVFRCDQYGGVFLVNTK